MIVLSWSAYRTHALRREINDALQAVEFVQILVAGAFSTTGIPPIAEHDLVPTGRLTALHDSIDRIHVRDARIEIVFGDAAGDGLAGHSLYLTPFETVEQRIIWLCGNRSPGVGLYPLGAFSGTDRPIERKSTSIEPRYLPAECR